MFMRILLSLVLSLTLPSVAQSPLSTQWGQLLNEKKYSQAENLCTSWTHSSTLATQVEAQKCLANLALCKGQQLTLMGNDQGGGSLGEGYTPKAVDEALEHLNEGLRLSSQDLSIHEGRLHILEVSGRLDDMAKALDQSVSMVPGADVSRVWLPYTAELADMGQIAAGLKLSLILNAHYPDSHDVIGNIGAFYSKLKQPDKSLPYLQKAVELAPNDALDNWNLGHALDVANQTSEADKFYSKALTLDPDSKQMPGSKCLYAQFVQNKLQDKERACQLQKTDCETERQTACAATPSTSDTSDTSHPQSP
jgi:tetratricopeptide (TPR) repeat protein